MPFEIYIPMTYITVQHKYQADLQVKALLKADIYQFSIREKKELAKEVREILEKPLDTVDKSPQEKPDNIEYNKGHKTRFKVLEYIRRHPGCNNKKLSDCLKLSTPAISWHLKELIEKEMIIAEGDNRQKQYYMWDRYKRQSRYKKETEYCQATHKDAKPHDPDEKVCLACGLKHKEPGDICPECGEAAKSKSK